MFKKLLCADKYLVGQNHNYNDDWWTTTNNKFGCSFIS